MPQDNHFLHQMYTFSRPGASYELLRPSGPLTPQSPEFFEQLAAVGRGFARANVSQVVCVHGTFAGNDALGLLTELQRIMPSMSERLRRIAKGAFDLVAGETGNFTARYAASFQQGLSIGAEREIPVKRFHWSSQNNHIGRADGAVRLVDTLAQFAENLPESSYSLPERPPRVLLWSHSHGGNVCALVSNLLAGDPKSRQDFFSAARSFWRPWFASKTEMPAWQRIERLLSEEDHPLRRLALDVVTFGTPVRYGWDSAGYDKLLNITQHRPPLDGPEYLAPRALRPDRLLRGTFGDGVQQVGIAGTNLVALPLAVRTFLADRRLGRFLERNVAGERLFTRLACRVRVPVEGTTLLVDYDEWGWNLPKHLAGHAVYTRRRWLPFHATQVAERLYGDQQYTEEDSRVITKA